MKGFRQPVQVVVLKPFGQVPLVVFTAGERTYCIENVCLILYAGRMNGLQITFLCIVCAVGG